jgi:hypothetical protein
MSLIALIMIGLLSCRPKADTQHGLDTEFKEGQNEFDLLPESFKHFYSEFHKDSLFQIAHVTFPLEGLPDLTDPEYIGDEKFFWSADQWRFHNAMNSDNPKFKVSYTNMGNVLIIETVTDIKYDLTMIRRFAFSNGQWALIYYAGMNKYSVKEK